MVGRRDIALAHATDIGRAWAALMIYSTATASRSLFMQRPRHTRTHNLRLLYSITPKDPGFTNACPESTNQAQAALPFHRQQDEQLQVAGLATADRGYMAHQEK